jgi:hypothetical protein
MNCLILNETHIPDPFMKNPETWKPCCLFFIFLLLTGAFYQGKENQVSTVPYFLVKNSNQFKVSPRMAALAWFEDARSGMFIQCPLHLLFIGY